MKTVSMLVLVAAAVACIALGCGKGDEGLHKGHDHEAAPAGEAARIEQKTCPVMDGNKINPELYVDHNGRRIYFCCKMCVGTFKKDPEKYIRKVDEEIAKAKKAG